MSCRRAGTTSSSLSVGTRCLRRISSSASSARCRSCARAAAPTCASSFTARTVPPAALNAARGTGARHTALRGAAVINRTGFLVAIALCRLHNFQRVDALAAFARVRPPGTWRAEYVHALHASFGGPPPQLPQPPAWEAHADAPTGPDPNTLPPPPPPFGAFRSSA